MAAGLRSTPVFTFVTRMHPFHPRPVRVSMFSKWQPGSSELHLILMALKINAEQQEPARCGALESFSWSPLLRLFLESKQLACLRGSLKAEPHLKFKPLQ